MLTSHTVDRPAELLAYLFATFPDVKKGKVRQFLAHGSVQVNGRAITQFNHPLKPGDVLSIRRRTEVQPAISLPGNLKVLFEDEELIVIDKPAGLLTMASETERNKTAYARLTDYVRGGDRRRTERVWIVHRLDREASGLMVFAKSEESKRALQTSWRQAEKRYQAVVEGNLPADEGVFQSHLNESNPYKVFSAPASDATRHAVTRYRVVKRGPSRTLVELTLETGRRNQIRVHLADARCPIVGDEKYGARTDPAGRLGLHACTLGFAHPATGEPLAFESPLPRELAALVRDQ